MDIPNSLRRDLVPLMEYGLEMDNINTVDDFYRWCQDRYKLSIDIEQNDYANYRAKVRYNGKVVFDYPANPNNPGLIFRFIRAVCELILNKETNTVAKILKTCPKNTPLYLVGYGYILLDIVVPASKHGVDTIYLYEPINEQLGTYRYVSKYGTKVEDGCAANPFDELILFPSKKTCSWTLFDPELYIAMDQMNSKLIKL